MVRSVSDSDTVRRQNRGLVLDALRHQGPLARTQLAGATGLSHASITAITHDMIGQGILVDLAAGQAGAKARGRPAVRVGFNRAAAHVCVIEIDVNRTRLSLVDYGATLVDRLEGPLTAGQFGSTPPLEFLAAGIARLADRNRAEMAGLKRIAASVQGILDKAGTRLAWSPVPNLAGHDITEGLSARFGVPVTLIKRGRLLADGARYLDPELAEANLATVFIGSTVAMGLSAGGSLQGRGDEGATEFGHMNHVPNGALCRCGMRGCIEAYAADYGILRAAFSVPETTSPATAIPPSEYEQLINRGLAGDRNATYAFNLAGRAIGYGLSRLLAVFEPSHVVIVGPGARAFSLMKGEIDAAFATSLVGRVRGLPMVQTLRDESEPIFQGLVMRTLGDLDQTDMAALAGSGETGRG